ncbi:tripartite tricarboxylate transporter substrate binding protein [Alkalihalobacillus sp. MEB130]|uniref:tripartite tricarboxylate transporter substrate binding protein n=1 Tax=Alkalihalobacillus sp. MEB130 TaxID=2976704 RepID=UPI0028DFF7D8|nr:tripartite tricarboxylate transporter substrate binding protein [Alkalihalobacillus sp. MEB130]MDT8861643.1 tripartite tricarboxylate transporter substrate binding protein [Alkalihalobacillus sp. MEB130]
MRNSLVVLFGCFLIFLLASCSNSSEPVDEFPSKSIELIVAFSPGAATDTQARIISKYASKYLGQELIIVNKPGGGGQVGWNSFSSVNPDGYTLAAYNLPHIITQPLVNQTSFEVDTFEPLVNWGGDPTVFAVKSDSDITSLEELVSAAQAEPGSITVGNAGLYVGQHLATLLLEDSANIDLEDVPFQGAADAIASVLGGHTDVVAGNLSDIYRLGDEVLPLAIATEERHPFSPNIPTFAELGYPEVVMSTDRGIAARKDTPIEVIEKLEEAFLNILEDEDFLAEMEQAGADMLVMNREEVIADMEVRTATYENLLKSIGVIE